MSVHYQILVSWDSEADLWVTHVPALDISTYGETRERAIDATREAILGYIEATDKEGLPLPSMPQRSELVDIEVARA
ncbi:MAG: type II toxin-antitoxin system HicB family antitoxin [Chloroflexota bacterium]|nr:MAG: type II toxin-antitoxin system HicB family antitoxin [Chloroflexota bacterium]